MHLSSEVIGTPNLNKVTNPATGKEEWEFSSTGFDPSGAATIVHEFGHAIHMVASPSKYHGLWGTAFTGETESGKGTLDVAKAEVSTYASKPREFVAEVFLGLVYGKEFSEDVMSMYRSFGGPIPPPSPSRWRPRRSSEGVLADDVVFAVTATGQSFEGSEVVGGMLTYFCSRSARGRVRSRQRPDHARPRLFRDPRIPRPGRPGPNPCSRSATLRRAPVTRRASITGVTLLCVVALVGCDTTKPSPEPTVAPIVTPEATASASPAASPLASPVAGTNVVTESNLAQSATLDEAGGTITATGSNGAVYTLDLPAGALAQPTTISLSPVSAITTLAAGTTLQAGVQFGPNGLQLHAPATLTIKLPSGTNAATATGIAWSGDGVDPHPVATTNDAGTLTYTVLHFSGDGADDQIPIEPLATCTTFDEQDDLIASVVAGAASAVNAASDFRNSLNLCYLGFVAPTLSAGIDAAKTNGSIDAEENGFVAYSTWLWELQVARTTLHDPGFTVAPDVAQARALGVKFLQAWYADWNSECIAAKDLDWHVPVKFARLALANTRQPAITWGVATQANKLDVQSLLDNLCAKVVIDPARSFTASVPGEDGTVKVKAGISIDHGPLVTAAGSVRVHITQTGSTTVIGDGPIDASGAFEATTTWPSGTDPVRYDILATLIDNESIDDSVIESIDVPTDIQRFDRITKHAERLSFTFNSGLDGWSKGTLGGPGDLVDNEHVGNGEAHMDGRGTGSAGKAWIDRTFTLPQTVTTFSFDLSAEIIAGSSSSARVVIEAGGVSKSFNFAISNGTNHLSYKRETIDLRPWAGQRVKIFVEQNYNGLGGFDKEIYVDNIRIALS